MPANTMAQELKYLFKSFSEGSLQVAQSAEDSSLVGEGKSAFFDVLQKPCDFFALYLGDKEKASVDLKTGQFKLDGEELTMEPIPAFQGDRKLIFYRRHVLERMVPARYENPQRSHTNEKDELEVTNSRGETFNHGKEAMIAQHEEEGVRVFYVWPKQKEEEIFYVIGYEITDLIGKTHKRELTIE